MQAQQLLQILSSLGRGDRCLIFCEMKRDSTARDRGESDTFEGVEPKLPGSSCRRLACRVPKPRPYILVLRRACFRLDSFRCHGKMSRFFGVSPCPIRRF